MEDTIESQEDIQLETPAPGVFIPPSITRGSLLKGDSYTHFSEIPNIVAADKDKECVLGVDEAGRGPVLGTQFPILLTKPCSKFIQDPWFTLCCTYPAACITHFSPRGTVLMIRKSSLPQ